MPCRIDVAGIGSKWLRRELVLADSGTHGGCCAATTTLLLVRESLALGNRGMTLAGALDLESSAGTVLVVLFSALKAQ
jgi:hypothetical protein